MNIRFIISCVALLSLVFLAGSPIPAQTPAPAETPEEAVVSARVAELGGSIQRNAERRITRVIIESTANLTAADMQAIGQLTSLEWIRLVGPSVTDEHVAALSGLVNLRIVDIENSSITDSSLEMLKTLPEIHTLGMRRNLRLSDNAIRLFAEFPNLQTLRILYNDFSPMSLYDLDRLTSIRVLDLRGLQIGDDTLMFIGDLENLEEIRIRSGSVTNTGIAELVRNPRLRLIELQDTSVSAGSAAIFNEMENLRSLRIFRAPQFGARAVEELGILTNLETLELRGVGCDAEALRALKPLTQLRTVEFSELPGLDAETIIEVLRSYPRLESIRIFGILPADDSVASFLATVPTLRSVSLPATGITDAGLEALTALTELTFLDIHANRIRVTPQGASVLNRFPELRRLIMPETLDSPALRAALLESAPRLVITINTYSHGT